MPIIAAELKWYKSENVTDDATNGGRMSNNLITSGIKNNLFPDVSEAERQAGLTRKRKLFAKVANDADTPLNNTKIHLIDVTPGGDRVGIYTGTQTDTENPTGTEEYGAGALAADVSAGGDTITVTIEDGTTDPFKDASAVESIWIGDGSNSEYHENCTISQAGATITITLSDTLLNAYTTAAETMVARVYEPGTVECTQDGLSVTSTAGDILIGTIVGDNLGAVEDVFTCTFTSTTAFDCVGTVSGAVGSGAVGALFSPTNTGAGQPYFSIQSGSFTGTWEIGDTVSFSTHPAAVPLWLTQIVPAVTDSLANNNFNIRFSGESA